MIPTVTPHRPQEDSALVAALRGAAKSWRLLLVCMLVGGAVAYGVSSVQKKQYQAISAILFNDPSFNFGQQLFGANFAPPTTDADRQAATNLRLVGLTTVEARAAKALGPGFTPSRVRDMTDVEQAGASNIVSITATSDRPDSAARVANAVAREFVGYRRQS